MSSFKCMRPGCGQVTAIPTRKWQLRKKGHVKSMWCWRCKQRTQHRML